MLTDPIETEIVIGSRRCTGVCGTVKPLTEFSPSTTGKYGRKARCRACDRLRTRQRYHENHGREEQQADRAKWKAKEQAWTNGHRSGRGVPCNNQNDADMIELRALQLRAEIRAALPCLVETRLPDGTMKLVRREG